MNKKRLFKFILLALLAAMLTTCEKPARDNLWDDNTKIDPTTWAPENLNIETISITERKLTWDYADHDIAGFKIDRKQGEEDWHIALATLNKEARQWNDTTLMPDNSFVYEYRLYAYAGNNNSKSIIASTNIAFPPPSNLSINKLSDISYKLEWQDNSIGEQGFKIDRKRDDEDWQLAYGIVPANHTHFVDSNVFTGKSQLNVQYRLYAFYETYQTTALHIATEALLPPPTDLSITSNSITSLSLNWAANSAGHDGFRIERRHSGASWQELAFTTDPNYKDETFDLNTTVHYRVCAVAGQFSSDFSANSYNTNIPPPTAPTLEKLSDVSYKLTWTDNSIGEQGFRIDRKTGDADWVIAYAEVPENTTEFIDENVFRGKRTSLDVQYRVYAFYENHESAKAQTGTQAQLTPPGNLSVTVNNPNSVTLNWQDNSTGEEGFMIDRKVNENAWETSYASTPANHTTFIDEEIDLEFNTYSYRIYAFAGNHQSAYAEIQLLKPTLSTTEITDINGSGAKSGGNISNAGSFPVTERGIVWSTSSNPTITNNEGSATSGSGTGTFNANLSGLNPSTTYYVRAYATNQIGTSYGTQRTFTTTNGLPSVNTASVTNITSTTAVSGGNVTYENGFTVSSRGVVWSTSPNPTIQNNQGITVNGSGIGDFTSNLIGLIPSARYFVRAYATNSSGTTYGQQMSFIALDGLPVVTTSPVTNITATSAQSGGTVSSDGGFSVTARGVVWSQTPLPDLQNNEGYTTDGSGLGNFTSNMTGLTLDTYYYVRAYATNNIGTTYGQQLTFTTLDGLPSVTTATVTNITATTAESGGEVTSDGGFDVTARGVVWSQNPLPDLQNNEGYTTDGAGSGSFISILTDLSIVTDYYVRAYATNSIGTTYGLEVSFATLDSLPSVTTAPVINITATTATSGGDVILEGSTPVIQKGVCWSTNSNPNIDDNITNDGDGIGPFISQLTGLINETTYYLRAYAINAAGPAYGAQVEFTTDPCAGVTPPPGYGVVSSSGKCWLDRNLGASRVAQSSTDAEAYGHLYQWGRLTDGHQNRTSGTTSTLSNGDVPGHGNFILAPSSPYDWRSPQNNNLWQGVSGTNNPCPSSYRLPTEAEWNAERLSWSSNNAAGAFNSPLKLPVAGKRSSSNGSLNGVGSGGLYWSATVDGTNARRLYFDSSSASMSSGDRAHGLSVRCLKD